MLPDDDGTNRICCGSIRFGQKKQAIGCRKMDCRQLESSRKKSIRRNIFICRYISNRVSVIRCGCSVPNSKPIESIRSYKHSECNRFSQQQWQNQNLATRIVSINRRARNGRVYGGAIAKVRKWPVQIDTVVLNRANRTDASLVI